MECQPLNAWIIAGIPAAIALAFGYFWGRRAEFRRWCNPRRVEL